MKKWILPTFLGLSLMITAWSQDPYYWQLTDEDGLPSMTVYEIVQDKKGFIWMATANGLCRFDGKEIITFRPEGYNDFDIFEIRLDKLDRVWILNLAGQLRYFEHGKFYSIIPNSDELFGTITKFELVDDLIYIHNKKRKVFRVSIHLKPNKIEEWQTNFSQLFIYENQGVFFSVKIDDKHYSILNFFNLENEIDYSKLLSKKYNFSQFSKFLGTRHIILFDEGKFYGAIDNAVYLIDKNSAAQRLKLEDLGRVNNIDKCGEFLFVAALRGLNILKNEISETYFRKTCINKTFMDRERNIWLLTANSGVLIIPSLVFKTLKEGGDLLKVNSLFYDKPKERMLLGLDNGDLNVFSKNKIIKYKTELSGRIVSINPTNSGAFCLSSDSGFRILNPDLSVNPCFKLNETTKNSFEDHSKNLWVGNSHNTRIFSQKPTAPNCYVLKDTAISVRTYGISQDPKGKFWIGTSNGIYYSKNGQTSPLLEKGIHRPYRVSGVAREKEGAIFFSTLGEGIVKIHSDTALVLNQQKGLVSNVCYTLAIDLKNRIWVGTNQGIQIMSSSGEMVDVINTYDGLPSNEINSIAFQDSIAWVGTPKGLIQFPVSAVRKNAFPPPIHLQSIKIWERDTTLPDFVQFPYHLNNFQFEYIGLGYRSRGSLYYRYRLIGFDSTWVSTDSRVARFPVLYPGDYKFEVVAVNEDNLNSAQPASFSFSILPPWWKTWWFQFLAIGFLTSTVGGLTAWRFQTIRKREKMESEFRKRFIELKSQALQAQMNPHFIFNALNAIQQFLTDFDQENAMVYLAKFARLIRLIFEQSKSKNISFDAELELLTLYILLEKLRFKENVEVHLKVSDELEKEGSGIFLPPLLIQPIIENAFKHGLFHKVGRGLMEISFSKKGKYIKCVIEDNGVGRTETKGKNKWREKEIHKSSGLETTEERLRLLHANDPEAPNPDFIISDLIDAKGNPIGTKVEMYI